MEFAEKNFKTGILNLFKYLKSNMNITRKKSDSYKKE